MKNKKKGFTLVELIVVLAILAILAAMLVPALTGYIDKANEKKAIATARQYAVAAQSVVSDAYADNIVITQITQTTVVGKNGTQDLSATEVSKYKEEFTSLSEIKSGDECTFNFNATSNKLESGSTVKAGQKTVTFDGTNWS